MQDLGLWAKPAHSVAAIDSCTRSKPQPSILAGAATSSLHGRRSVPQPRAYGLMATRLG